MRGWSSELGVWIKLRTGTYELVDVLNIYTFDTKAYECRPSIGIVQCSS